MFDIKFMINTRIYVFEQILGQVLKISKKTSCFVLREAACARTDRKIFLSISTTSAFF